MQILLEVQSKATTIHACFPYCLLYFDYIFVALANLRLLILLNCSDIHLRNLIGILGEASTWYTLRNIWIAEFVWVSITIFN